MPASSRAVLSLVFLASALTAASGPASADTAAEVYRRLGIETHQVLAGTTLSAKVVPGSAKQVVALTTYFTGKSEKAEAVNVRLDVFERRAGKLEPIYSRDIGAEAGGHVAGGDLELVDLDLDGLTDIIIGYDSFLDPLIEQRLGEVILYDERRGFHTAWAQPMEYDATRAARNVPAERRDRYEREIDLSATLRARGLTLFVQKKVLAVAGERLPEPKIVEESFPLRAPG